MPPWVIAAVHSIRRIAVMPLVAAGSVAATAVGPNFGCCWLLRGNQTLRRAAGDDESIPNSRAYAVSPLAVGLLFASSSHSASALAAPPEGTPHSRESLISLQIFRHGGGSPGLVVAQQPTTTKTSCARAGVTPHLWVYAWLSWL